jgi:hypothetical protein
MCGVYVLFVTYAPKSPSTANVTSLLSPGAGIVSKDKRPGRVVKSSHTIIFDRF